MKKALHIFLSALIVVGELFILTLIFALLSIFAPIVWEIVKIAIGVLTVAFMVWVTYLYVFKDKEGHS